MTSRSTADVVVVGGGIVGLSAAYQLARDGLRVALLERAKLGREASWAGAGVIPPGSFYSPHPVLDDLAASARGAHAEWSERLRAETGVDDEYRRCGALYLETPANADHLTDVRRRWGAAGVGVADAQPLPGYAAAWRVDLEAQVRPPARLSALAEGCRRLGVRLEEDAPVEEFGFDGDRVAAARAACGEFSASDFVLAAGCWTPGVAEAAGAPAIRGKPMRGQMLLLAPGRAELHAIRHDYPHYAVPRRDGRVLVGSTVEDVGFDRGTTDAARRELLAAAERMLATPLGEGAVERVWSGLRPAPLRELPLVGRVGRPRNLWVATGHFRAGLQFAPPTAALLSRLIRGEPGGPLAGALAPDGAVDKPAS